MPFVMSFARISLMKFKRNADKLFRWAIIMQILNKFINYPEASHLRGFELPKKKCLQIKIFHSGAFFKNFVFFFFFYFWFYYVRNFYLFQGYISFCSSLEIFFPLPRKKKLNSKKVKKVAFKSTFFLEC